MLSTAQLDRINHIRTSSGRNAVTMEQAEILIDQMNETDRTRVILVISKDELPIPAQTCEDRIAAAVAAERERCYQIANRLHDDVSLFIEKLEEAERAARFVYGAMENIRSGK